MPTLNLSVESQHLLEIAYHEACAAHSTELDILHIFIALSLEDKPTRAWLTREHQNPDGLVDMLREQGKRWFSAAISDQAPEANASYISAMRTAQRIGVEAQAVYIEPTHLLHAVLDQPSRLLDFLGDQGIAVRIPVIPKVNNQTYLLKTLGRDLTELARNGELGPVIGREKDVERLIEILLRHGKNNALLLGDAGVGKTAVVEKLAQTIVEGRVPAALAEVRLIELSVAGLVAGTTYRGQFEERLQALLDEIKQAGNIIIVIDEFHTIVRAGAVEGGSSDAGNMLKPALARGELTCIGITTQDEYSRYIEKDAALTRRFQTLVIEEPSLNETVQILRELKSSYETHHNLSINDDCLQTIVNLSAQYLPSRRMPDKAIDVLATACSRAQLRGAVVDAALIAEVVGGIAGVPVAAPDQDEVAALAELENQLFARVIGQTEAVKAIAQAVRLSRVGLKDARRPTGVFMFVGPTGVGKTELARALADVLFGSEQSLIRFDMSEFSEKHSVARLIGAPPGYLGHEDGGQLTQAIRQHPYSVILFDEVEKAHPDVFDLFLQLFDEGRLTDTHGRIADGRNALFILTSNLGSQRFESRPSLGFYTRQVQELARPSQTDQIMDDLKGFFRAEFLNRIDQIILFRALQRQDLKAIAQLQLDHLSQQLQAKEISLTLDDSVLDYLADEAYQTGSGARALQRIIQHDVTEPISDQLVAHYGQPLRQIRVHIDHQRLRFEWV